jgi:hypothetical protein
MNRLNEVPKLITICANTICREEIAFRGHIPNYFIPIIENPMNICALVLRKQMCSIIYQEFSRLGGNIKVNYELTYPHFLEPDTGVDTPFTKVGLIQDIEQVQVFVDELIRQLIPHCEHFRLNPIPYGWILIETVGIGGNVVVGRCFLGYLGDNVDAFANTLWSYYLPQMCRTCRGYITCGHKQ